MIKKGYDCSKLSTHTDDTADWCQLLMPGAGDGENISVCRNFSDKICFIISHIQSLSGYNFNI